MDLFIYCEIVDVPEWNLYEPVLYKLIFNKKHIRFKPKEPEMHGIYLHLPF